VELQSKAENKQHRENGREGGRKRGEVGETKYMGQSSRPVGVMQLEERGGERPRNKTSIQNKRGEGGSEGQSSG